MSTYQTDVENRSEIVFLYDAEDCNPNGDPLSADNKPRVDEETGRAVVTDVRLKRFIRDQLYDDGHGIYILNPSKADIDPSGRDELFLELLDIDSDELSEYEPNELFDTFIEKATDVRYFGAPLSFSEDVDNELDTGDIPQFTGPVQFSLGRSLNEVVPNRESKKLSVTVTSGGEAEQGTFATDHRLAYALVRFHGVVNENAATGTGLSNTDVERLDTTLWRAIKNQTLSRSKMGHSPRLYLRVEYDGNHYEGDLDRLISIDSEHSKPDQELRSIDDVTLDITDLLNRIEELSDQIETVHVVGSKYLTFSDGENVGDAEDILYDGLQEHVTTDVIDVYA
ncbi:type I-B CRISPR-associated protein Cas7/Csh2 [Haloplanus salinus]|uniref:Type I-B CRISPR-associated protein Cas7/Csh2 n=1 Tax=Haloplanus salinus TaxID=1126245 RepID=A0A368NEE3_9EURY|nr:type I-B CRISPR-associated protein Cas7/Csh2 [Haloplanus salinus]RCU47821.1 type I-B CRISPR-associated protein Cas7/Csh2 [Haloplanus salinus]